MGVVSGPLFSLGASGTIAKTLTYSHWRGIPYARQRVIPTNPQSQEQTDVRTIFANLNALFANLPANTLETWQERARGRPYIGRNALISANAANLRGQTTLALLIPLGARGAVPQIQGTIVTDGGAQLVHVVTDAPPTVAGMTFLKTLAIAIQTWNPETPGAVIRAFEGQHLVGPASIDIDVQTAATYLVGVCWQYTTDLGDVVTGTPFTEMQIIA